MTHSPPHKAERSSDRQTDRLVSLQLLICSWREHWCDEEWDERVRERGRETVKKRFVRRQSVSDYIWDVRYHSPCSSHESDDWLIASTFQSHFFWSVLLLCNIRHTRHFLLWISSLWLSDWLLQSNFYRLTSFDVCHTGCSWSLNIQTRTADHVTLRHQAQPHLEASGLLAKFELSLAFHFARLNSILATVTVRKQMRRLFRLKRWKLDLIFLLFYFKYKLDR